MLTIPVNDTILQKSIRWMDFLQFPIVMDEEEYPQWIRDIAQKTGADIELIAKQENARRSRVVRQIAYRRQFIEMIISAMESSDFPDCTVIEFEWGERIVVAMPYQDCIQLIDLFVMAPFMMEQMVPEDAPKPRGRPKKVQQKK